MEIRPGEGVGAINFGVTTSAVVAALGMPESVSDFASDNEVEWTYPSKGHHVSFNAEGDRRVVSISAENDEAILFGAPLVGMSSAEMREFFSSRDITVEVNSGSDETQTVLEVWSLGLTLLVEDDVVISVLCQPVGAV